jgi:hypothetical protein
VGYPRTIAAIFLAGPAAPTSPDLDFFSPGAVRAQEADCTHPHHLAREFLGGRSQRAAAGGERRRAVELEPRGLLKGQWRSENIGHLAYVRKATWQMCSAHCRVILQEGLSQRILGACDKGKPVARRGRKATDLSQRRRPSCRNESIWCISSGGSVLEDPKHTSIEAR